MADLQLDILVIPTYNKNTLGVADASTYPNDPPAVSRASIEVTVPGFGTFIKPLVLMTLTYSPLPILESLLLAYNNLFLMEFTD
jgi:hypothetical protein